MREINTSDIISKLRKLCIETCCILPDDVKGVIADAKNKEKNNIAKSILSDIEENYKIAEKEMIPMCQDTGMAVLFVELGQEVHIVGGDFYEALNEGVRQGYKDGYLRKSVLSPVERKNTNDNTPAIIHTKIVKGDGLKITFAPKGFGSENMSQIKMLKPSDGIEGIKDFIINTVVQAGGNPCPPIVVGVGIGGTFEKAAYLAKKSLLREINTPSHDERIADLEKELLTKINRLDIGPQGLGGDTTALAVHIIEHPTHIAGMPVAVNIQCHAARHGEIVF